MIYLTLVLALISFSWAYKADTDSISTSMVPRGKIIEKEGRDFWIKTRAGTKVQIELYRNGNLEEASGKNLNRGDEFEPGQGLVSLATAAKAAVIPGTILKQRWKLDFDEKLGWVYEFEGEHKGVDRDILVDAKRGEIILGQKTNF